MNVASKELCKELYGLADWKERTSFYWQYCKPDVWLVIPQGQANPSIQYPAFSAYDLGYLLRKLPTHIGVFDTSDYGGRLEITAGVEQWFASYDYDKSSVQSADTPEDAACKLCIALIKAGTLKP